MKRVKRIRKLFLGLALLPACGGGGGPSGIDIISIAGLWLITQSGSSSTCGPIPQSTFEAIITQSGSEIQISVEFEGFSGEIVYRGTLSQSGDFNASQSTLITTPEGQVQSTSTVTGHFTRSSVAATETETLVVIGGGSCVVSWRWVGNK